VAVQPVRFLEKNCCGKGLADMDGKWGFSETVDCFVGDRSRA